MEIRRPLKRAAPKLGPPDIYPQDPKQKEDELTSVNVKQGYTSAPLVSGPNTLEEFGSAKDANIAAFGVYFSALLSEKHRVNRLKDTQKKKQLVNTKEIWLVHAKTKHAVDNWFRDLANGTKSLGQLGKRIPSFNNKEGMFAQLYESQVPLAKAIWFIKMSAVHAIAVSEASSKSKKRQVPDHYQELTTALTKYLKEISIRMSECYQQSQQQLQTLSQQSQQSSGQQANMPTSAFNNPQSILQQRTGSSSSSSVNSSSMKPATLPQSMHLSSGKIPPSPTSGLTQQQQLNSTTNNLSNSYTSLLNHQPKFAANLNTSIANLMTSQTASTASLSATTINLMPSMHEDFIPTYNQWQYLTQLARYLFDEGLLDQHDFLCFLLELIEKKRPINDIFVKVICPLILEYVIDFSRSAVLSRRLAHVCAKKSSQALNHHPMCGKSSMRKVEPNQPSPGSSNTTTTSSNTNSLGINNNFMAKHSLMNLNVNKYNHFESRISDTQSSSLLRNSSSTANNNHLTSNSILDIVKAQIIESQNNLIENLTSDQENSESNLYKNAIYILSSILQVICIECPTAMVRHRVVDAKFPPMYQGSPLDHLPCLPSSLPMMDSDLNFELRKSIHDAEREILHRSAMADSKWSCDSSSRVENSKGGLVNRLLTVMDTLDKHDFDKIDAINSIDILYAKIFPSLEINTSNNKTSLNSQSIQPTSETGNNSHLSSGILDLSASSTYTQPTSVDHGKKSKHQTNTQTSGSSASVVGNEQAVSCQNLYEEQVIKLLCEWATTTQRTGEHRAIVVARLLEKRQTDLQLQANALELAKEMNLSRLKTLKSDESKQSNINNEPATTKSAESTRSDNNPESQEEIVPFSFQNLLVQFLDENAPVIKDSQEDNFDTKKAFNNLVLLFSELIRCDVFSHFNYMCTLISRGMFNDVSKGCSINTEGTSNLDSPAPNSNLNQPGSVKPPKSVGKESDSVLSSTIQGFSSGNSNIYPLSVSTSIGGQSNHLDPLSNNKSGSNADQSLRSLGFSPVSSQQNVSQNLDKGHGLLDNHIDDVDADLGKILQDINGGQQDEAADILLPDYLGGGSMREETGSKNPQINKLSPFGLGDRSALDNPTQNQANVISNSNFQPSSVESKPMVSSVMEDKASSNPSEYRHMTFVKHFPVPEDENFLCDNNQRIILLYGFGKEREEAKHSMRRINKDILKLLGRKSCRDISDGAKIKKQTSREVFNPDSTLGKFEALSHHDQHILTNGISVTLLEMFTSVANGQSSLIPSLETISFVFDLFSVASNVSGLLDLVIPLLEQLPDVEAQIQSKCPQLQNQYTQSIALCIIGMLYRYHSCLLLLSKEELCSVIESLYKIVPNAQNSNIPIAVVCTTSAERVIFHYIYDLYNSQTGRFFEQFSIMYQRVKQVVQNKPPATYAIPSEFDWTPGILTEIVNQLRTAHQYSNSSNNPILNASSGNLSLNSFNQMNPDITLIIKQQFYMMDSPNLRLIIESYDARYKLVCEAITLSANSPYPDLVNDIAVLCADITTKCPSLSNDWIQALQALCCSAQRDQNYRLLTNRINIAESQVMDNIAIFTAVLVARRCLELDHFIVNCALGAILAPLGFVDKQLTEPGVRLTCHLLLTLFRDREFPNHQARGPQAQASTHNTFAQNFSNYGNSTPNYANSFLNSVPQMGLLQTISKDSENNARFNLSLKYLCDHHLLRSACCNIKTECHITLLKAIRLLAMWACPNNDETQSRVKTETHFDDISMDGNYGNKDLEARDYSSGMINSDSSFNLRHIDLQKASLHEFADAILRLLCSQRWLHSKCLSDSDIFTTTDTEKNILLDPKIDVKQSQRLLYMICYNKSPEKQADVGLDDQGSDQVASIVKMFENLDVWSMRLSLMRLQFMFAYCKSQSNVMLNDWLDNLAKAVVEFFQKASQESENQEKDMDESTEGIKKSKIPKNGRQMSRSVTDINKVWLIEPLLDKLTKPPSAVQAKIIKATASLMESASVRANSLPSLNQTYLSTAAASTKFKERTLSQRGSASTNPSNLASTSLLGFQPFLSLVLSCLRNQDKERDTLLTSLNSQLYQAIHEKVDDIGYKQSLQDGLELRLCLIGQMFETIQRSPNLTSDWATLLLLLIMNNLVDPQVDYGLYVSVLDMLAMLIHSAYASDPIEQKEEAKKQYQNLMKKFRKELAALEEKGFIQMKLINPLMPLVRQMTEVITCEPMGSLVDTKGEKVENFESIDKKKGLKVSELQEVSPWDLIEGHKNPAPLSWPWFGAIRIEQKPLRADENNRLMSWHTHTVRHTTAYFCQVPNVEDGPSSAKRSHTEKKPSQSNPLLKSLIEASDDGSLLSKKEAEPKEQHTIEDEAIYNDSMDEFYIGRDDLLEDYCELPVDLLFDSTPIETMIEDIKTAMQAEHAAIAQRAKPPIVETKSFLNTSNQASSILAPVQPPPPPACDHNVVPHRSTTPQVSALNALQSSVESSLLVNSAPGSVPPLPMAMSPLVNPATPELIPRPPSNIPKITPTPPPPLSVASRSMSPMITARSPAIPITTPTPPPPKPKATRKRRTTKKDTNPMIDANANLPANINKNPNTMPILPPPNVNSYGNTMDTMNHVAPPPPQMMQASQAPKLNVGQPNPQSSQMAMHQQLAQQQQQGMIVRRGPIAQQQQQQQQAQQQQASVYDFPSYTSQPQQSNQFVSGGPINSYYEQQGPTSNMFNQPQPQQPQQMQTTMQSQHQHHPVQQQQPPPQQQHQLQAQQQHIQQHQHHQIQYQQPVQHQHQHGPTHHQQQQPQHMQPQQIRLAGHHQQSMSFQQIQHHQHPAQQQIFAPQQAAGHSRPALTAMLHQKHAAAGNIENKMQPQPRFNFN